MTIKVHTPPCSRLTSPSVKVLWLWPANTLMPACGRNHAMVCCYFNFLFI